MFQIIIRPAEVAVIVLTFSEYLCQPVMDALCIEDLQSIQQVKKAVALAGLGKPCGFILSFQINLIFP